MQAEEERRRLKKEKKKEKEDQLRREGKLLSKKQKAEQVLGCPPRNWCLQFVCHSFLPALALRHRGR